MTLKTAIAITGLLGLSIQNNSNAQSDYLIDMFKTRSNIEFAQAYTNLVKETSLRGIIDITDSATTITAKYKLPSFREYVVKIVDKPNFGFLIEGILDSSDKVIITEETRIGDEYGIMKLIQSAPGIPRKGDEFSYERNGKKRKITVDETNFAPYFELIKKFVCVTDSEIKRNLWYIENHGKWEEYLKNKKK